MEISVDPGQLGGAATVSAGIAGTTSGVHGTLGAAAAAEGGCQPEAAGAFASMQQAWMGQLRYLAECDNGLAQALGNAEESYPATDRAQMVAVWKP